MRGDIARLGRCTLICTQGEDTIKRSKPFKYAYEKEIVMCVAYILHPLISTHSAQVCVLQETGLFLNGVYLLAGCVPRPRASIPQRPGSCEAECHHRHHTFWRDVRGEGGSEGNTEDST